MQVGPGPVDIEDQPVIASMVAASRNNAGGRADEQVKTVDVLYGSEDGLEG